MEYGPHVSVLMRSPILSYLRLAGLRGMRLTALVFNLCLGAQVTFMPVLIFERRRMYRKHEMVETAVLVHEGVVIVDSRSHDWS
jgi:hypothetical protein